MAVFAERELSTPLGIENYRWARFDGDVKVDTGGHLTPQAMVVKRFYGAVLPAVDERGPTSPTGPG